MLNYKKRQFTFIVFFIVEIPLLFSIAPLFSFNYCCKNTQMTRDLRTRDPYGVHQTKIQVNFTLLNLPYRTSYNQNSSHCDTSYCAFIVFHLWLKSVNEIIDIAYYRLYIIDIPYYRTVWNFHFHFTNT